MFAIIIDFPTNLPTSYLENQRDLCTKFTVSVIWLINLLSVAKSVDICLAYNLPCGNLLLIRGHVDSYMVV
jgi:hypothetical protein